MWKTKGLRERGTPRTGERKSLQKFKYVKQLMEVKQKAADMLEKTRLIYGFNKSSGEKCQPEFKSWCSTVDQSLLKTLVKQLI